MILVAVHIAAVSADPLCSAPEIGAGFFPSAVARG